MPRWRYVSNRVLTLVGNALLGTDDFVFDNQMIAQAVWFGYRIGEVSCPTRYEPESSSITFARSVRYGFGRLATALRFRICRWGLGRSALFPRD